MIPGNDDSLKSINLFTKAIADAVLAGKTTKSSKEVEEQKAEAGSFYDSTGHSVKVVKIKKFKLKISKSKGTKMSKVTAAQVKELRQKLVQV